MAARRCDASPSASRVPRHSTISSSDDTSRMPRRSTASAVPWSRNELTGKAVENCAASLAPGLTASPIAANNCARAVQRTSRPGRFPRMPGSIACTMRVGSPSAGTTQAHGRLLCAAREMPSARSEISSRWNWL